jgi:hypothetical protein
MHCQNGHAATCGGQNRRLSGIARIECDGLKRDFLQVRSLEARPTLKVRFRKPLTPLPLTATRFGITNNQAQHKLGLGHPAPLHQEFPLPFFSLLASFTTSHPTHKRALSGLKSSTPTILLIFIGFL